MARRGRMEADRSATSAAPAVPGSEIAAAADGGSAARGWLRLGRDGRLTAYASCAEGLVRCTESAPGSDIWQGPELFPVEGWAGRFTLAQDSNGFVWFAGTRYREGAPGGRELIIATQYQTGRPLGDWRAVGNPFPERKRDQARGPEQLPGQEQPESGAESGAPLPHPETRSCSPTAPARSTSSPPASAWERAAGPGAPMAHGAIGSTTRANGCAGRSSRW